jgi:hypothetical protein
MKLTKAQLDECWNIFLALKEEALYLSHYQLAELTTIKDAFIWKEFLMDPKTVDYVSTEMNLIRTSAINKMVAEAPHSRSVGQSQLINALQKLDEKANNKEGPVFIYCYVPLNKAQTKAPNVRICNAEGVEVQEDGTYVMYES